MDDIYYSHEHKQYMRGHRCHTRVYVSRVVDIRTPDDERVYMGKILNLSQGGALFTIQSPYASEVSLFVKIRLQVYKPAIIRALAKINRIERQGPMQRIAIEFLKHNGARIHDDHSWDDFSKVFERYERYRQRQLAHTQQEDSEKECPSVASPPPLTAAPKNAQLKKIKKTRGPPTIDQDKSAPLSPDIHKAIMHIRRLSQIGNRSVLAILRQAEKHSSRHIRLAAQDAIDMIEHRHPQPPSTRTRHE